MVGRGYPIYQKKIYYYPINLGFLILNQNKGVGRNFFLIFIFFNLLLFISSFFLICFYCYYSDLFSILLVNVCVSVSCPLIFFRLQDKERQSHSLPVILTYFTFMTTTFRDVFKVYIIFFILESMSKIQEKCGKMGIRSQGSCS